MNNKQRKLELAASKEIFDDRQIDIANEQKIGDEFDANFCEKSEENDSDNIAGIRIF